MSTDQPALNPLDLMSSLGTIDDITKRRNLSLEQKAKLEEEIAQYKVALNRLATSPDGQFFLRKLIKFAGIYSIDAELNPAKMVEDRGKRKAYLELVRPYLTIETRTALESET